jgi:MFS family permease
MAGGEQGGQPRKRFSRSGHTSHGAPPVTPHPAPPYPPAAQYPPVAYPPPVQYPPVQYPPVQYPPGQPAQFGTPTYHAPVPPEKPTARARAAAVPRYVTRKVISASEADGARESGLTPLIWNQVLSYGADAMITVALASTVFFGASAHAQRGHVLLYLLVTMAPFAVVAPVIGPALDRVQHGRRWAMAGTAVGRAVLAAVMAMHPTDLLVLYPCALGSLVLSKAYGVIRAAAAPRLVPPGMTLVQANARLSIFGLGSAVVGGSFVGLVIKSSGSYSAGLWVTGVGFAVCAYFAVKLPPQVDSATPAPRYPGEPPRPRVVERVATLRRIREWASRGYMPHVITALEGESALRFLTGLLTIFLAFYIESTRHGFDAAVALGAVLGAAGVGNFLGTAAGARITPNRPDVIVVICTVVATAACVITAVLYNINVAVLGMLIVSAANALGKLAMDALIQREVPETLRSSAFGRSETFLQLAWVLGAATACLVTAHNGSIGFWIGSGVAGAVSALIIVRTRTAKRLAGPDWNRPSPPAIPPG